MAPSCAARRARHAAALLVLLLSHAICARAEPGTVLASIRPIALLAEELAGGEVRVEVLAAAEASPHDFVLRPSEWRAIVAAPLVLWMGPALEQPLERVFAREPRVAAVALLPAIGEAAATDPHLWLDPRAAARIADAIAGALHARGLVGAPGLEQRRSALHAALAERERAIAAAFAGLERVPFVSLHDGYRPFVARFGLEQVGALPGTHESQPGARSVAALREAALARQARCLLLERGDNAALARNLAREAGLVVVEVDPLARRTRAGPGAFDAFLRDFAADVARCLGSPRPEGAAP